MSTTPPAALRDAIIADPDADAPRLALADWWEAQGQPEQAEFTRLQVQARSPDGLGLGDPHWERYQELSDRARNKWVASLPKIQNIYCFHYDGIEQEVSVDAFKTFEENAEQIFARAPLTRLRFYSLRSARKLFASPWLGRIHELDLTIVSPQVFNTTAIATLCASPQASSLRSLALPAPSLVTEMMEAIGTSRYLTNVHTLVIKNQQRNLNASLPALTRLPALPPQLTQLALWNVSVHQQAWADLLASPVVRQLTRLDLLGCQLGPDHLALLGDGSCLASLREWNLCNNPLEPEGIAPLAAAHQMRHLRRLYLSNTRMEDAGLLHLAQADHLAGLMVLAVGSNFLTDAGLKRWLDYRPYPALAHLEMDGNRIGDEGLWALGQSTHLPALRHLRIFNLPARQAIIDQVVRRFVEKLPPLNHPMPCPVVVAAVPVPTSSHADEDGLLQAMIAAPHDPVPRLVYADWLEEQGEADRAALLRAESPTLTSLPLPKKWANTLLYATLRQGLLHIAGQMRGLLHKDFGEEGAAWLQRQRVYHFHLKGKTKDWSKIAHAKWLQHIRIFRIDEGVLDRGDLAKLLASPHLERLLGLELPNNGLGNTETFTALTTAPALPHLCSLSLAKNWLSASVLASLVAWPGASNLRYLDLTQTHLYEGVAVISTAQRLRGLTRLVLDSTYLHEVGFRAFVQGNCLHSLTHLHLRQCALNDECLRTLAVAPLLRQLCWLDLRLNSFSYEGMLSLAQSPNLPPEGQILLNNTGLSDEQSQRLRNQFGPRLTFS